MQVETRRWLLLLAAVLLISGCGGNAMPTYSIVGTVLDAERQGVSGVKIEAGGTGTETNEDGEYFFDQLSGVTTIVTPETEDYVFYPRQYTVSAGGTVDAFVRYQSSPLGEDAAVPGSGVAAFAGIGLLDFRDAGLEPGDTITVSDASEATPAEGMTKAGAVVQIQVSGQLEGPVKLLLAADTSENSAMFHGQDGHWQYVSSEFQGGYREASVEAFSHYGVFSAPQTPEPDLAPLPGDVTAGTAIEISHPDHAAVYYTIDGTVPTLESILYDADTVISVGDEGLTMRAIALLPNHRPSAIAHGEYAVTDNGGTDNGENGEGEDLSGLDRRLALSVGGESFDMILVERGTFPGPSEFITRTVVHSFYMADRVVTYDLWSHVYDWAVNSSGPGYQFANEGRQGGMRYDSTGNLIEDNPVPGSTGQHPVTKVSWRDAVVWCNALSEYLGIEPYYLYNGEVFRNSQVPDYDRLLLGATGSEGFRLPTDFQWELAARDRGSDNRDDGIEIDGRYWTPANYASGAQDSTDNTQATDAVAWTSSNTGGAFGGTTKPVAQLNPNELGFYDMGGNVWEWTSRLDSQSLWWGSGQYFVRGGSWADPANNAAVAVDNVSMAGTPDNVGIRLVHRIP